MADQRTIAQLLQAPTEGYEDAIVVPAITADNFELKHELHQLDTFYNPLNSKDQDSLNSATGGNFLDIIPRKCLAIIEGKSKVCYSRNKPVVSKVSMNASTSGVSPDVAELKDMVKALLLDKKSKNQSPATMKAVEESCVTCGGAHSYRNCQTTDGNNYRDNIQEFVSQAFAVNYNQGNTSYRLVYQPPVFQPPAYQAPVNQALAPQTQCVSKEDFLAYAKANDAVMRNMQTQGQNMQNQLTNLTDLITKFLNSNTASTLSSSTVPSNTIANPKRDLKAITTRSSVSYDGPQISPPPSSLSKVVENEPEPVTSPIFEPEIALISASKPNSKASIPYPSRRNDERNHEKANNQIEKFYQIFKDMSFEISFTDALILMPKFTSTLKALIGNTEKLSEMAQTPLNEHCSAVLLKNLPKKLGDPGEFMIPCDFPGMAECLALADLGASINLMPFSMWKRLSLLDLTLTCMTLKLADRSISRPVGVSEDVYVKVGSFHFSADFAIVYIDDDPRLPLILGRSFLKTGRALIDVFEGELTLRVDKEAITFNLDQTSRYSANYSDITTKRIDVLDMACEEYSQERSMHFLLFKMNPLHLNFINLISTQRGTYFLEAFLNNDPSLPAPNQRNYMPEFRKELKICEAKSEKSSVDEPPVVELKDLPPHLEYAFLEGDDKLPVIIAKDLSVEEKTALLTVLNPWVSPVHCVPKKEGFTVVENEDNELIPTRLVTGWRKPHSPAHTKRLIIATCLLGYAMLQARFRERMLKRCEDPNLCINWEKSHFMVKEGIVLGHKISKKWIEVDKAKDMPFELMYDASDFAIGAVLGQRQDKHFRPIHYASKTMTEEESNYTTTKKEMLAVVIPGNLKTQAKGFCPPVFIFSASIGNHGTTNVGLINGINRDNHMDVTGFVDSDYAKDPDKGKSITGYAFLVQGCVVSWKATLQHVVALSTTEAEYMALMEAVKEAIWLKGLLEELGVELNRVTVNCDNQGAIHLSRNHNDVHVSANGSNKTDNLKHDEKARRDDKGKSSVDSLTGVSDLNMPELEDIIYSDDEEDVGAAADLSNLETNIPVSPIPSNRVHTDHPINQIISDLNSAPQIRSMTRMVKEQGGLHQINDEDFHTCMFVCFLSQKEPKKVHQALKDLSWIKAIQEELLQFKLQKFCVLVDLAKGKRAIGLKWFFRNKKDKRGIVIRNKARLVAYGHTQEEGIDYDEVFAPVARIEAIRLCLAYASFMGFIVYQMDVKSAFLYGTIEEERFGFTDVKAASTPIETEKPLLKDPDGEDVDVHIYRYLKGKPHLGLWYIRDSPFNLMAYSDSDYAGASLYRKFTTGVAAVKLMLLDHKLMLLRVVVSEAIIRRDLHLDDTDGVECLPNEEIFEELARMRYEKPPPKLTFYKAFFSAQWNCSMASAVICLATDRKLNFSKYIFNNMVRNVDGPSKFLMYPHFLQVVMDNQLDDMTSHNIRYTSLALTQKLFTNMRRVGKDQPSTPHDSPPQEELTTPHESFILLLTTLMETCATLSQKVAELEQDKDYQALGILQLKKSVKKLEKKKNQKGKISTIDADEDIALVDVKTAKEVVSIDVESHERINQEKVNVANKGESFKKLKAVEVSGSKSTLEKPSNDAKEMNEEDVQNMLEIVPIIRVGGITHAYQVFEDMLKGFDREDLVALWNLVKEKFSLAVPSEDKEKALWVELKRLFKLDADDVLWKLQRYMYAPLTCKMYNDYEVHHVSSTRGHDIFMLTKKDYPLSNVVMMMLSRKVQVEEDNEMARDLVMKIFMEANKPKSKSLDTSSK
uniref:Reverse transcriptase domain-containing protein n=1 Tax=Tanacetum cinerariifolium TaxID=118510 RepID=A0A6L2KNT5_TANCI|nr:reverse transcriptase domain-containing protein [Tanacetum cinerariifolium]